MHQQVHYVSILRNDYPKKYPPFDNYYIVHYIPM